MPSTRKRHCDQLVQKKRAHIVSERPLTIRLHYHSPGITRPLYGGVDPGRTNIGLAVRDEDGNTVYLANVSTRNKDVPKLMAERKQHRQASRRGERLARIRLAHKHDTIMDGGETHRHLPGYEDGDVLVKDIINTEARFNNRKRPDGWITPTVRQLIQTHLSAINLVCKILPVTHWSMEMNKFAFAKMDDQTCYGVDFQTGRMKGYVCVKDYVYDRQDGKCHCCGSSIEHYHHVVERSQGGSDLSENIIGVCKDCHQKIHTGKITLSLDGIKKKYGALSVLNQAIPYVYKRMRERFGEDNITTCLGYETKAYRQAHHVDKDHNLDALCIASVRLDRPPKRQYPDCLYIRQFRQHNRQIVRKQSERTYYLNGKVVCKNRHKRFGQVRTDSLEEFRTKHPEDVCHLTVKPSKRSYNNVNRIMPGALFEYQGKRYVLTGTKNKGTRYMYDGCSASGVSARQCHVYRKNTGLVYM